MENVTLLSRSEKHLATCLIHVLLGVVGGILQVKIVKPYAISPFSTCGCENIFAKSLDQSKFHSTQRGG